jgi:hypothetical protein
MMFAIPATFLCAIAFLFWNDVGRLNQLIRLAFILTGLWGAVEIAIYFGYIHRVL